MTGYQSGRKWGGFICTRPNLYLSELSFINQFYSRMTSLVLLSLLANDYFRHYITIISSNYFHIVCYRKVEVFSGLIFFGGLVKWQLNK